MKLSTRSSYGMRALVELALAGSRGPVSATLIANRQHLSLAYLEQLLHRLKKHGIITSVRGPKGGYVLAKDPKRITMAQVVGILEGANGASNGGSRSGRRANARTSAAVSGPSQQAERIVHAVWRCVHERLTESLDAVTLQDLCEEVHAADGEPIDHRYVFHI